MFIFVRQVEFVNFGTIPAIGHATPAAPAGL
jgi:hypothetical protein